MSCTSKPVYRRVRLAEIGLCARIRAAFEAMEHEDDEDERIRIFDFAQLPGDYTTFVRD